MSTTSSPHWIDPTVEVSAQSTELTAAKGTVSSPEDELVEIDLHPGADQTDDPSCGVRQPKRQSPRAPLPRWMYVDLDQVLPHKGIEEALRAAGIETIQPPSRGFVTAASVNRLALSQPIHVVRRNGTWNCFAGWDLLREAQAILPAPRVLPVCVHSEIDPEEVRGYVVTEQATLPLRYQKSNSALRSFVVTLLVVTKNHANFFMDLKAEQWAALLGRSLRWWRTHTAAGE